MVVFITGSSGFIGRHLIEALGRQEGVSVIGYDLGSQPSDYERGLAEAEVVFHLAGVNRPEHVEEFTSGNVDLTATLCRELAGRRRRPVFVLSSSIQAACDNPYGISKRQAEEVVQKWAVENRARAVVFRLKNVFGKWCRPNYNSVTATFCHNIAHDLPISISDPNRELELIYIDDVVEALLRVVEEAKGKGQGAKGEEQGAKGEGQRAEGKEQGAKGEGQGEAGSFEYREVDRVFRVTLGSLAERIRRFRDSRRTLVLPDFADDFNRCLYATYLSYLEGPDFAYALDQKTDPRGSLAEFVKSPAAGQIFVSRTKPGITRGNHYHHTKTEKFLVVEGEAVIRFRKVDGEQRAKGEEQRVKGEGRRAEGEGEGGGETTNVERGDSSAELITHRVSGREFKVVDIPPGYTHSIENVGEGELVTLFWASEIFDPQRPDTYGMQVL